MKIHFYIPWIRSLFLCFLNVEFIQAIPPLEFRLDWVEFRSRKIVIFKKEPNIRIFRPELNLIIDTEYKYFVLFKFFIK